ncbi:MAG: hypothetical protein R3335_10250, partial [Anaerolineales bacterium]|nr:hypothetical protein [Anaerolineales bacterium]
GYQAVHSDITAVVRRAVGVKVVVIRDDPYEQGLRAALNFGHTIGHAVESASDYRLRHGEAVAIGMVVEARLSESLGLAQDGLADRLAGALRSNGLPTDLPPGLDPSTILRRMLVDKKNVGGKPRFALPIEIGKIQVGVELDQAGESALQELITTAPAGPR